MTIARFSLVAKIGLLIPLVLAACTPAEPLAGQETPAATQQAAKSGDRPVLSDTLKRGCPKVRSSGDLNDIGLDVGATAVDFTLEDTDGNQQSLSVLLAEKPVVMVFGSFT